MTPAATSFNGFHIDVSWLATMLLVSIRLAAVLVMTPVFYAFPVPATIRVLFVIAMAVMITLGLPSVRVEPLADLTSFILSVLSEVALGTVLGLGILVAFSAFSLAGALIDVQIGYGIAQIFDPVTNRQLPILTSAFNQLAVLIFFLVNGHHALMRGIAYSFEHFPPGSDWRLYGAIGPIFKQAAGLFTLGFALIAPVVFCLLLVELGLGILARNLPQINMLSFGIPIKIVVGLVALTFWMSGAGDMMSKVYFSIFQTWQNIFDGAVHV